MFARLKVFPHNVPLDNSYTNSINYIYLKNNNLLEKWFTTWDNQYNAIDTLSPLMNFNFNDGVKTSVVVDIKDIGVDLISAMNANYAHLRLYQSDVSEGDIPLTDYYYFITSCVVKNDTTIAYELELDVMTTYGFILDDSTKSVVVERSHYNRWHKSGSNWAWNPDGDYLNKDSIDGLYNAEYTKHIDTYSKTGQLHDIIWAYFFFTNVKTYESTDIGENQIVTKTNLLYNITDTKNTLNTGLYCFCLPVNANLGYSQNPVSETSKNFYDVYNSLRNNPYCIACNFSILPPYKSWTNLNVDQVTSISSVDGYKVPYDLNFKQTTPYVYKNEDNNERVTMDFIYMGSGKSIIGRGFWVARNNIKCEFDCEHTYWWDNYVSNRTPSYNENDMQYDPKLYSNNYRKLDLYSQYSDKMTLDFSMFSVSSNEVSIDYYESVTPFGQEFFITPSGVSLQFSEYKYNKELIRGISGNYNYATTIFFEKFNEYVANNKNYKQIVRMNAISKGIGGLTNASTDAYIGASTSGPVGGVVLGAVSAIGSASSITNYILTSRYQWDNLQNAPSEVKQKGLDIYFDMCFNDLFPKMAYRVCKDVEMVQASDFIMKYGYYRNKRMLFSVNPSLRTLCTRVNYNYIKIKDNIRPLITKFTNTISINNKVVNKINEILNNGITLWNCWYTKYDGELDRTTEVVFGDYTKPNWETGLLW